jgi:putative ABC transport system permease protein
MNSLLRKLSALFGRSRRDIEIHDELAFHLQEEAEEQQQQGRRDVEALQAARRSLGNVTGIAEETRAAWGFIFVETALQDFRIALRSLVHNPRFSIVAILILGLGIGASTAVFSVVNAVILKPLAFPEPHRIVSLSTLWKNDQIRVSYPDFEDWRTQSSSFESMAFYSAAEGSVVLDSGPSFVNFVSVSNEFFQVLGVQPALGRSFSPEEMAPGGPGAVIISDSFWAAHFGRDPSALGKTIRTAGGVRPVVGVMPPGFRFPNNTEMWTQPLVPLNQNRGAHNYTSIARLKPGVSVQAAQAEMTLIGNRLEQLYKGTNSDTNFLVTPLGDEIVRGLPAMLYLLLGAVLLLLLISCGNVANLLLARAATRTRELGVRTALGASRVRIVRQLATESLVLGLASGAVGLLIAQWGTRALVALAPGNIPRLDETGVDSMVLIFAAGLTLLACVLFGLTPAVRMARVDVNGALKQGSAQSSHGLSAALRYGLVVAEVAVSVVLLTGAGLLIRSFAQLSNVPLGFETRGILVMETTNPRSNPQESLRIVQTYKKLIEEAQSIKGIYSVGAVRIVPGRISSQSGYAVDGEIRAGLSNKNIVAVSSVVSPGAFGVLGIPILAGRDFSAQDSADGPLTAIINETLARRTFANTDPIGHQIMTGFDRSDAMTIVGVVGDTRQRGPGESALPEIFMPYEQHAIASTAMRIIAKTSVRPEALMPALRERARQIAPNMPVKFVTLEDRVAENVAAPRFRTLLVAIFAVIALVLSMAGVYGVVSFLVNQRAREIGLRMALGAGVGKVMNMVLSQGVRMGIAGLVLGVAGAFAATQFLTSLLFEVKPFDPLTYVAVAVLMGFVTIAACLLPAWRAARIDPMLALRQE